ncbi:unnamed protein product [Toxocara canis]|uniref:FSH1 domain-containing protein n=1 Tax=Toxocara canis TaxID=6265 RepID=A0A183VG25_TOXCA|nr:unnamed protein product [Toxocara canis]
MCINLGQRSVTIEVDTLRKHSVHITTAESAPRQIRTSACRSFRSRTGPRGWWFSRSEHHFSSHDVTELYVGFDESVKRSQILRVKRSEHHFSSHDVTELCIGFDESVKAVTDFASKEGPFDGIFAFSQGAALAFLLAALRQRGDHKRELRGTLECYVASVMCCVVSLNLGDRILCLHGYRQNETIFREKTGSFRKALKSYADFVAVEPNVIPEFYMSVIFAVFMTAPHVPVLPAQPLFMTAPHVPVLPAQPCSQNDGGGAVTEVGMLADKLFIALFLFSDMILINGCPVYKKLSKMFASELL